MKTLKVTATLCLLASFTHTAHAEISSVELDALQGKIILAESSGNPKAIGDHGRARGLMQIQESTWERFSNYSWDEAFDADKNVQVGRRILEKINIIQGSKATIKSVALAYNTGAYNRFKIPEWAMRHPNKIYRSILKEQSHEE